MPARWYVPLVALLAGQDAGTATVTLSLAELDRLASGRLPRGAWGRAYWYEWRVGAARALGRAGWWVVRFDRDARAVTFARVAVVGE